MDGDREAEFLRPINAALILLITVAVSLRMAEQAWRQGFRAGFNAVAVRTTGDDAPAPNLRGAGEVAPKALS